MEIGLRERKKHQTREALHHAAIRLFAERGFEATTTAEIAAAVDIAPRTFFAYFPTKEDVVFGDADLAIAALDAALRHRRPAQTALDVLRECALGWTGWLEPDLRVQRQLIREVPSVEARHLQLTKRVEERLAAALAEDLGERPHDLRPRLAAAAAIAALLAAEDHAASQLTDGAPPALTGLLEEMVSFVTGGLTALDTPVKPGQ